MKRLIWTIGGFCAAATGLLVWGTKRTPNLEDLAPTREDAWVDRDTAA